MTPRRRLRSFVRAPLLLGAALTLGTLLGTACGGPPTATDDGNGGSGISSAVTLSASLNGEQQSQIKGLAVTVTGAGITVPIILTLDIVGTTVNGTVVVPTGANRTFSVKAFDVSGIETYSGSATVTIKPGTNPTITITLFATTGGAPITVTVGTYSISIAPTSVSLAGGTTATLTATVRDANSNVVSTGSEVQWGSSNPVVVALSSVNGASVTLTGGVPGTATVVASYRGIAIALALTVTVSPRASAVSAGAAHSCALLVTGTTYCWGANSSGQLGDGGLVSHNLPALVAGTRVFGSITSGGQNTCALEGTSAFCWGENTDGQVGDGTTTIRSTPTAVSGGHAFTSISSGGAQTCALAAGPAYCWGNNLSGQLGDGTTTSHNVPTLVSAPAYFASIAPGTHTCAANSTWTLLCWGSNESGQLGDGTQINAALPQVMGPVLFQNVGGVARGVSHTCVVTSGVNGVMGAAYCWGKMIGSGGTTTNLLTPTLWSSGLGLVSITAGNDFTCALTQAGLAYCWGNNNTGQLGDGTTASRSGPTLVAGGFTFSAISSGGSHTCGIIADGSVRCWGSNLSGQLGDGTTTARLTPTPVVFP